MEERLKRLIALRKKAQDELDTLFAQRKAITDLQTEEAREDFTADEDQEFRVKTAEIATKQGEVEAFDERIRELSEEIERSGRLNESAVAARKAQSRVEAVREQDAYTRGNGQSYFKDLMMSQRGLDPTGEATERLRRHAVDVKTSADYRKPEIARALDTTDGNGGYFVPPVWLVSDYIKMIRAGRAYADLCKKQDLPANTNAIQIPKVTSGTSVAFQNGENTAIQQTDLDDDFITVNVRTIAGGQDISLQLLEQSAVNFDEVVFGDLLADHAAQTDLAVLAGSGTNGQIRGVHNTPGIGTVAIAGGVTMAKFYGAIANGIQKVHTGRKLAPTHIAMHPRRWAWLTAALDGDERPLVLPAGRSVNNVATLDAVESQQIVGELQGLPVLTDPNIGTSYGAGETPSEDIAYVQRSSDMVLYESGIRTRVLPEIGGKTLTVHLQVYSYVAFTAERYPSSVVEITGLTAPTFS
ncbi:phage major capsid protein [Mycolicibacterium fortuitum]|uniref:phage major capsid protein n=1 Tax=Mycolicibacterium fortuitum TaxID=1766 RepID=UPI0007EA8F1F|nr:phage major capsid protein [Mycolicibacterium fortuitum]OBF77090.1 major capsid protein [Mycolicibacterium fortuitum]